MRLLLDQNLSHRLLGILATDFPGSNHVRNLGLARAGDEQVWEYAAEHGMIIASKDSDFHQRSLVLGPPPKVVWLRTGNCATDRIAQLLLSHREELERFGNEAGTAFLVLS